MCMYSMSIKNDNEMCLMETQKRPKSPSDETNGTRKQVTYLFTHRADRRNNVFRQYNQM